MSSLDDKVVEVTKLYLDRRADIFIEEALSYYVERHGVAQTIDYLKKMVEYFEQF